MSNFSRNFSEFLENTPTSGNYLEFPRFRFSLPKKICGQDTKFCANLGAKEPIPQKSGAKVGISFGKRSLENVRKKRFLRTGLERPASEQNRSRTALVTQLVV